MVHRDSGGDGPKNGPTAALARDYKASRVKRQRRNEGIYGAVTPLKCPPWPLAGLDARVSLQDLEYLVIRAELIAARNLTVQPAFAH